MNNNLNLLSVKTDWEHCLSAQYNQRNYCKWTATSELMLLENLIMVYIVISHS